MFVRLTQIQTMLQKQVNDLKTFVIVGFACVFDRSFKWRDDVKVESP